MREIESSLVQAKPALRANKVLVVIDRFPATGGSRIDKFVKLLPDIGFEPVVLSAKETDSPHAQEIKRSIYPSNLKTYQAASIGRSYFTERFLGRGPGARHFRLLSLLSFPERCALIPDYMVRWIPLGIRLAKQIVRRERIDIVLTSSPPESTHLIGLRLKQELGVRWVADFRDLWTEKDLLYRPATPLHDRWVRRLERKIFDNADHIIANTPENAERYIQRFGLPQHRFTVIPNGFDRDDLIQQRAVDSSHDVFRIGYAGSLDKHDFPWRVALDALKRLALEVGRDKVRFVHCGYLSEQVKNYLKIERMKDLVEVHGSLAHEHAMRITANTEIRLVLLYENPYSASIVPLKLYNYLIMNGPILAIAPEKGRTASIIAETRMGTVISPNRGGDAVYRQLQSYYKAWSEGTLTINPDHAKIASYDRRKQVLMLAKVLTPEARRVTDDPPCRVAHFHSSLGVYGAERWTHALVKYLDKREVEPIVISMGTKPGADSFYQMLKTEGHPAFHIPVPGKLNPRAILQLRRLLVQQRIAILHTHGFKSDVLGYLATWNLPVKLVATIHGWTAAEGFRIRVYEAISRAFLKRFDRIYPLSPALFEQLQQNAFDPLKLRLMLNAVDLSAFEFKFNCRHANEPFSLLFAGRLCHPKGIFDLIQALARARFSARAHLTIVGDGPDRMQLAKLSRALGVEDKVTFAGAVSSIASFLAESHALVLPSYSEGIPRVVMEAFAAGVPVIGTAIPGIKQLVEDESTGLLVPVADCDALARALERLCQSPDVGRRMAFKARQVVVESYCAQRMANDFQEQYRQLRGEA